MNRVDAVTREGVSGAIGVRRVDVPLSEVTHFKAADKYVTAYYEGGELVLSVTIKEIAATLGDQGVLISRSCVVLRDRLLSIRSASGAAQVEVRGLDAPLWVARLRVKPVRALLQ